MYRGHDLLVDVTLHELMFYFAYFVYLAMNIGVSMEIKRDADSNDITECSHAYDKPGVCTFCVVISLCINAIIVILLTNANCIYLFINQTKQMHYTLCPEKKRPQFFFCITLTT